MDNINTVPWIAVYGVVAVSTIVSNLFFLFVVFINDRLRHMHTTLFLIGLAVADLIVGAVAIPMFMAILWPGSEAWNREADLSYYMIEIVSSFASLFLLSVIALERVYSVFWPHKHRALSKTPYYSALFISWFLAALQMILKLLQRYNLITLVEHFYALLSCMVAVVVVIIVSYFVVWRKIKTNRVGSLHQRRDERERKLAKTLAILTAVFLITWIPFSVLNAFVVISRITNGPSIISYKVLSHLTYASKVLHYSNSLANPVIYSFRFPEVRGALAKIFCRREQIVAPTDLRLAARGGEGQESDRSTSLTARN